MTCPATVGKEGRVAQLSTGSQGKQTATALVMATQSPGSNSATTDPGVDDPGGIVVSTDTGTSTAVTAHPGEAMTTKESCTAEMRALRKRAGNFLLLAPLFLHDRNLLNARVMLLVGQVAWTEQTRLSTFKTTGAPDRQASVLNSTVERLTAYHHGCLGGCRGWASGWASAWVFGCFAG